MEPSEQALVLSSSGDRRRILVEMMALLAKQDRAAADLAKIYKFFFGVGEVPRHVMAAILDTLEAHPSLASSSFYNRFSAAIGFDVLQHSKATTAVPEDLTTPAVRTRTPVQPLNIASTADLSYQSDGGRKKAQPSQQPLTVHSDDEEEDLFSAEEDPGDEDTSFNMMGMMGNISEGRPTKMATTLMQVHTDRERGDQPLQYLGTFRCLIDSGSERSMCSRMVLEKNPARFGRREGECA